MGWLMLPITELIEEVVDLVTSLVALFDVQSNERCLHEWHDLLQKLAFLLLDYVLVQGVGRIHELGLLVFIFAELAEILLIKVMEEAFESILGLLQLCCGFELGVRSLSLQHTILCIQVLQIL